MAKLFVFGLCSIAVVFLAFPSVCDAKKKEPEMMMQDGMMMIKGGKKGEM